MSSMSTKSGKGTFIVQVVGNENSTWQGKLTWTDTNQSRQFRSALELIKLMDEALGTSEEKKENE